MAELRHNIYLLRKLKQAKVFRTKQDHVRTTIFKSRCSRGTVGEARKLEAVLFFMYDSGSLKDSWGHAYPIGAATARRRERFKGCIRKRAELPLNRHTRKGFDDISEIN